MTYKIELEREDLTLIGDLLDAQLHGRVGGLVARIQAQITKQDMEAQSLREEQARSEMEKWFASEIEKRGYQKADQQPAPDLGADNGKG